MDRVRGILNIYWVYYTLYNSLAPGVYSTYDWPGPVVIWPALEVLFLFITYICNFLFLHDLKLNLFFTSLTHLRGKFAEGISYPTFLRCKHISRYIYILGFFKMWRKKINVRKYILSPIFIVICQFKLLLQFEEP